MKAFSFILLALWAGLAHATPYGTITANEFMSMDLSKTWLLPAGSDTLAGISSPQTLSNKTFASPVFNIFQGVQQTTPACPPSGSDDLYFKSDNNLYTLNSACVETQLGSGGGGGGGTVTSVGLIAPAWLTVTNSPVTTNGNLTLSGTSEPANEVLASPNGSAGALAPRALVAADVPTLNQNTTGNAATASALAATPTGCPGGQYAVGIAANGDLSCAIVASAGTVTSVGLADGSATPIFSITNSPVTTNGTLTESLISQPATLFLAGPASGANAPPTFRAITATDLPGNAPYQQFATGAIDGSNTSFSVAVAPAQASAFSLYLNGMLITPGIDYSLSGSSITMNYPPAIGSDLYAVYGVTIGATPNFITGVSNTASVDLTVSSGTLTAAFNYGTLSATAPLAYNGTGIFSMPQANGSTNGFLGSSDWTIFNGKQATIGTQSAPSNQFFNSYAAGVFSSAQVGFSNLSGSATAAQMPAFSGDITTPSGSTVTTLATVNSNVGTFNGITVNGKGLVTAASSVNSSAAAQFGVGLDGAVTISAGTTTLTRDMYYSSLTISGSGKLSTNGFKVFVSGTLDLSAAPAGAISIAAGNNGSNGGSGGSAGAGGSGSAQGTIGGSAGGVPGAAGGTGGGTTGTNGGTASNGGAGGATLAAGSGSSGAGGAGRSAINTVNPTPVERFTDQLMRGVALISSGVGGCSGGSGGGDGAVNGGGGGGNGTGGGELYISASTLNRGASTTAGAISAIGANGGNGGSPASGNAGGGAGGAGGGGGWIYFAYGTLTGATGTNMFDVTGGQGGAGGNGFGTGLGGGGGGTGSGGRVTLINITTPSSSSDTLFSNGTAGNAASGITGGAVKTATTSQVSL